MAFIFGLIKLLTAGQSIGDTIAKLQQQRLTAANDADKHDLDLRIATLQTQADVQRGSHLDDIMRAILVAPVEIFLWKVIVIDKVMKLGVTDPLDPNLWYVVMMMLGFYFLTSAVGKRG